MAVTFGFYNAVGGDRTYNAEQMSAIFEGMINDGILESIEDALEVTDSTGMDVLVGKGRAWFFGTWTNVDSAESITISASDGVLNRIDTIVLEVNKTTRTNSIKAVEGSNASSPSPPALTDTAALKQYPLADIYVGAGVSSISTGNITDRRGDVDCPFATGILRTLDTQDLVDLENEMDALELIVAGVDNKLKTITTTGSSNAYIATYPVAHDSYSYGDIINIEPNFSNTASATINVDSLGVKNIRKQSRDGFASLDADDMKHGNIYTLIYDGTYFVLINPSQESKFEGNIQIFESSGTFTAPHTGKYKVAVIGGGGNSGYAPQMYSGGGSGGIAKKYVSLNQGDSVTVTVGTGGAAYTVTGNNNGNPGGTSSFGAHCSATGGDGGRYRTDYNTICHGGPGGVGSNGDINVQGNYGFDMIPNETVLLSWPNDSEYGSYGKGFWLWTQAGEDGAVIVEW